MKNPKVRKLALKTQVVMAAAVEKEDTFDRSIRPSRRGLMSGIRNARFI